MKSEVSGECWRSRRECLNHHRFHVSAGSSMPSPTTWVPKCAASGQVSAMVSSRKNDKIAACLRTSGNIPEANQNRKTSGRCQGYSTMRLSYGTILRETGLLVLGCLCASEHRVHPLPRGD